MSQADVSRFVTRALDDAALRAQLGSDPDAAFDGYDLSEGERQAIQSGDEDGLKAAGLDPMTARSWMAFHDVGTFEGDMPDVPGDISPAGS